MQHHPRHHHHHQQQTTNWMRRNLHCREHANNSVAMWNGNLSLQKATQTHYARILQGEHTTHHNFKHFRLIWNLLLITMAAIPHKSIETILWQLGSGVRSLLSAWSSNDVIVVSLVQSWSHCCHLGPAMMLSLSAWPSHDVIVVGLVRWCVIVVSLVQWWCHCCQLGPVMMSLLSA